MHKTYIFNALDFGCLPLYFTFCSSILLIWRNPIILQLCFIHIISSSFIDNSFCICPYSKSITLRHDLHYIDISLLIGLASLLSHWFFFTITLTISWSNLMVNGNNLSLNHYVYLPYVYLTLYITISPLSSLEIIYVMFTVFTLHHKTHTNFIIILSLVQCYMHLLPFTYQ